MEAGNTGYGGRVSEDRAPGRQREGGHGGRESPGRRTLFGLCRCLWGPCHDTVRVAITDTDSILWLWCNPSHLTPEERQGSDRRWGQVSGARTSVDRDPVVGTGATIR